ncbi:baculovirus F protein domain-containing protein [Phthorimaea operculella]|nr:baculovirus F protein domain-containing protein [Phthorimaea operculella]
MSPQNLIFEILQVQEKTSFNPVAEVSIHNIYQIERSIDVKAYSTEHTLTFILEIPSVESNTYDLIHLYSIPNHQNFTIIPKSKYLVLGSEEYTYLDEDCRAIAEDIQLCKQLTTRSITGSVDCVLSLIQHEPANCTYAKMNLRRGKIQKINSNSWLVIMRSAEIMKSSCNEKTIYNKLTGVHIISLTDQCQAHIFNSTLQTHSKTIFSQDIIPLPKEDNISPDKVHYELQLEEISLDSIHQLINKAENLRDDSIPIYNWQLTMATPSWTTIILYIIGSAFLLWKLHRRCTGNRTTTLEATPTDDPTGSCGGCFHLKEGGVTMPNRLVIADLAPTAATRGAP